MTVFRYIITALLLLIIIAVVFFSRVVNLGSTALREWRLVVMIAAAMAAAATVLASPLLFAFSDSALALSSPSSSGPPVDFVALNCARLC